MIALHKYSKAFRFCVSGDNQPFRFERTNEREAV